MYVKVAWRNAWRNPRRTLVIMTAVVIGVWSMIFLGAFMRGMLENMLENGKSVLTGDIQIHHKDFRKDPSIQNSMADIQGIESVLGKSLPAGAAWATRIRVSAVASNARHSFGVTLVGTDFNREKGVSFIGAPPYRGSRIQKGDENYVLVGKALMDKFDTDPGKKLILMTRDTAGETVSKAFRIKGVFRAQMASVEKQFVFAGRETVSEMVGMPEGASEISIVLPGESRPEKVAHTLRQRLDTAVMAIDTWKELLPMLKAYTEIFDGFMRIWYVVVFIAMGFGIVNTTLMAVFERIKEFGLLRALGMKPARIVRSVVTESAMILITGMAAGNLLGVASVYSVGRTGLDLSLFGRGAEFFGLSSVIYPVLAAGDLAGANLTVFGLGVLVSLYPAVRAACITPVEAMRDW